MPHRNPPSRLVRFHPARFVIALLMSVVASMAGTSMAQAAKVYRCPDGSYADKPCGEGQRVVTTTRRHTAAPDEDKECVAMADDAEELANGKAGGMTSAQALKRVDEAGLPYEQRTLRKKFVVKVYQTSGSPAEVRSLVEADCVSEKKTAAKAAEDRAAADKAAAEQAARAAGTQTSNAAAAAPVGGPSKAQCEELRRTLAMLRNRQRDGGTGGDMEQMRGDQRDTEKQLAGLCPP